MVQQLTKAKKIVVIGNAGGGKSHLCRQLSQQLNLPLHAIDHIQWQPGWVRLPLDQYAKKHAELLSQDHWLIDGVGPWEYITHRLEKADLIIYVDLPLWQHYLWATKRQLKCLFKPRIDGPPGCPMLPITFKLYRMMWHMHHTLRPRLLTELSQLNDKVIHLKSAKALKMFSRNMRIKDSSYASL